MDKLTSLRVFLAVAEQRGFAAAARKLALSPPAVTRAIASLEESLGTPLLHRTTRQVRLTEAGARYAADVRRILDELEDADAAALGEHAEPRGVLSITAPTLFGRMHVAPLVLEFLDRYPRVTARTLLVDRIVDLLDEGFDVGVRIGHLPPESSLNAARIGQMRQMLAASPSYLRRRGRPQEPAGLAKHDTIMFSPDALERDWVFETTRFRPHARLRVNTGDVAIAAAVAGHGIVRALSYQVAAELEAGRLELVLEEHALPPIPVHVVYREGRRAAGRVRAFVDFVLPRLRRVFEPD